MSTNPTSFRLPFTLPPGDEKATVHPEVISALRYCFNGLKDLNDAIPVLHNTLGTTTTTATTAATTATAAQTTATQAHAAVAQIKTPSGISANGVNNQSGNTAYTLQQGDYSSIIIVNTASPFALDLSLSIGAPFYCVVENLGSGTITATPDATGTVNGGASATLIQGQSALFFFDGRSSWWITTLPPLVMPVEFLVSGFTVTKATEAANTVWAGPTSGASAVPTFRSLVSADLPSANVATLNLTGQTNSIGTTTLYAVSGSGAGMYRLSYYLDTTTAGTAGTVTATFGWTDNNSNESVTSGSVSLATLIGSFTQGVITFYSKASVNITYSTTVTGPLGSPQYELRVRLEYLG